MRYSGAGNTFHILDNRDGHFSLPYPCEEDGILLLEKSSIADFKMRTINRDGSEAEMCGNGLRCFIRFLQEIGLHQERYQIETLAGLHTAWSEGDGVCVEMLPPKDLHFEPPFTHLNTGVPHTVLFVESVDQVDVEKEGKALRERFGSNVNFVQRNGDGSLSIRTYERGVEAETLACGTGATAVALVAAELYNLSSPLEIHVRSKERLKISFTFDRQKVILSGPVLRLKEKNLTMAR